MNFKNKFKLTAAAICVLSAIPIAVCASFKNQGDVNLQADNPKMNTTVTK
ncbi:hypothetical protein [Neisseria iguanae]|nr:hypothetical protein [Neisseria iguanae]